MRIFLLLALILTLAAPVTAQTDTAPTGRITVEDNAATDAAIANRIRDILQELGDYEDVTVSVSNGIVLLRGTTLDAASAEKLDALASRVEGVVAVDNRVEENTDVIDRLNPLVKRFEDRLWRTIAYMPLLLVALTAFAAVTTLGFLLARLSYPWDRIAPNAFIADIYRQIVRLAFILGGLVIALDILNATALLSTILGAAGIIGLAIGFAVRDTVENFIASVMLSIRQPFQPNDAIEIGGDEGVVIRLTSRATILLSFDGNHIRIPNASVFKSRIVNYTRNRERRFTVDFGVAPDTDLVVARDAVQTTLQGLPFVLETPAPSTWVHALGDSTITLRCTGWIDQTETDLLRARGEAIRLIKDALDAMDVQMPEPTLRIVTDDFTIPGPDPKDDPTEPVRPEPRRETPPDPPSAPAADVSADHELERIASEERMDDANEDLLTDEAPKE